MEEIKHENLVVGKQYYCYDSNHGKYNTKSIGTFWHCHKYSSFADQYSMIFKEYRDANCEFSSKVENRTAILPPSWKYYEVKKYKIQTDMEERACNLILQHVVGDPYFKIGV